MVYTYVYIFDVWLQQTVVVADFKYSSLTGRKKKTIISTD